MHCVCSVFAVSMVWSNNNYKTNIHFPNRIFYKRTKLIVIPGLLATVAESMHKRKTN
jgi:hypothetical protein